jgi:hypothetical protein
MHELVTARALKGGPWISFAVLSPGKAQNVWAAGMSYGERRKQPMVETDRNEEHIMASIVIKDLTESVDLDRKAMTAIIGGARTRGRVHGLAQSVFQSNRIVNYPSGFTHRMPQEQGKT